MVTVGGISGNKQRGKKGKKTQATSHFLDKPKFCISFIGFISFIAA